MGISDQLFKITVMKMFDTFRKTIHEQNKEAENIKKGKPILELKTAITDLKNSLEGFNHGYI